MSWRPLLTGSLAASAEESIQAIATALAASPPVEGSSYSQGHAGIALFHGYFAAARDDESAVDLAEARLEQAAEALQEETPTAGFYLGPAGVAWVNQHLEELLTGEEAPADLSTDLDGWIAETVRSRPWQGDYDLFYGLAGLGCYALDHPDHRFAAEVVHQIVARLDELAEPRDGGLIWWTSPDKLFSPAKEDYPEGYYNLGLSHGVPGIIGMLGRACGLGFGGDRAWRLLDGAVAWLLANRRPDDGGSAFAPYLAPSQTDPVPVSRSAWCYGDPGIAAALLPAARWVGEPAWEREALAIALKDAGRPMDSTRRVVDAGLCHGAAGLGHIYNRLYQATGEEALARTARDWFARALSMRREGQGLAGYGSWWTETGEWLSLPGLLAGAAGVGLALIAATSTVEPGWDRPMLLATPPTG